MAKEASSTEYTLLIRNLDGEFSDFLSSCEEGYKSNDNWRKGHVQVTPLPIKRGTCFLQICQGFLFRSYAALYSTELVNLA